jgi:hypothetical protein
MKRAEAQSFRKHRKKKAFTVSNYEQRAVELAAKNRIRRAREREKICATMRQLSIGCAGRLPLSTLPYLYFPPITFDLFHFLQENRSAVHFNFSLSLLP